jgi:hypothetical protein
MDNGFETVSETPGAKEIGHLLIGSFSLSVNTAFIFSTPKQEKQTSTKKGLENKK